MAHFLTRRKCNCPAGSLRRCCRIPAIIINATNKANNSVITSAKNNPYAFKNSKTPS